MSKEKLKHIVLDHGTGGKLSGELIGAITERLGEVHVGKLEDSAILPIGAGRIAVTTDSFVIDPIFFGNGNIGHVAVCGTVNDLAVSGATPKYLTLAFVLETGFPVEDLERILDAIREAAKEAGVLIVAGDTKVVRKGEVDKIFINTAGVGEFAPDARSYSVSQIRPGDHVIVTGELGNHSIHILSIREGLGFETKIKSDCAPLNKLIADLNGSFSEHIHTIRDITRGGLGTVLNEIAAAVGRGISVEEQKLPILHETAMAANMLGVNPLYLANEGNLILFVAPEHSAAIVERIRQNPYGRSAAVVGVVDETTDTRVHLTSKNGETKTIDLLYGAELPRLC
ncbi:hydrogenase expression/formation protein HypE [Cohnella faecalis]|uniref:Hydrogenase expression/formation protein HypE n=1 Tax=Cohnella faecalis TaxID=2315694 RepID=A0A398CTR8_9BACL|nr:hydrogenase expression/formation protein HypE [Cohnella faecalis]